MLKQRKSFLFFLSAFPKMGKAICIAQIGSKLHHYVTMIIPHITTCGTFWHFDTLWMTSRLKPVGMYCGHLLCRCISTLKIAI